MKKNLIIFILVIGFGISSKAQLSKNNHYLGINLFPIIGNTLELGCEINFKPDLSTDFYTGYVFNNKLSSPLKAETQYELDNKSGFFIKIGARYNVRNNSNKFAPFIGLNIVNSMAIEEGIYDSDFNHNTPNEQIIKKSYNLGINEIIGITSPATKRINIDLGLQFGKILINNLIDSNSHMPGMGINFGCGRVQGIVRIKCKM